MLSYIGTAASGAAGAQHRCRRARRSSHIGEERCLAHAHAASRKGAAALPCPSHDLHVRCRARSPGSAVTAKVMHQTDRQDRWEQATKKCRSAHAVPEYSQAEVSIVTRRHRGARSLQQPGEVESSQQGAWGWRTPPPSSLQRYRLRRRSRLTQGARSRATLRR